MINTETLSEIKDRFTEVNREMSRAEIATDPVKMRELSRERGRLESIVEIIDRYQAATLERDDLRSMMTDDADSEMRDLARAEFEEVEARIPALEDELRMALIPRNPEDSRDAILEIRAGTGGDEASLFAGDLFRLYSRYAEQKGWRIEIIEASEGTQGGFKEIVASVQGADAFGTLKYESGVHRVQRVPATESSGRIHTSAATVAVLPEAEEVDVSISPNELKIDVYRSSGPGGQSVNTTDSAVRITHIPTGLVVTCQDEKSQHKNKDKALRVLRSRLYEVELEKQQSERSEARKSMVGSGDRSAKIRTYNFPQDRLTDHRLEGDDKNHPLHSVINGDLDLVIRALRTAEHAEQLSRL
jgi:peptide chain release factor 1